MDMIVDDKPDLVDFNEQLGNSKTDFDNITETAQDIEQSLDGGIKSCDVTVVSEHSVDENVKSLENRMYNFSDSVVGDKVCEEDIDSNYTLVIENVQERNDKGERCKDMESIVKEVIEFLDKEDDNIERFKNIDDPDASLSARSEDAVKEDSWMMSNKGGEQDSHIYVEKSQIECWNSASGATEGVQLGPSNDGAPRILECPVNVRLEISADNEFSCSGNENTSGSNSDQQENDLLKKLDEQSSSLDPLEEHKKLIIPKKEVTAVGDLEGCEISYSSQLEQAFPMASEASYGDVGKEKTVQNANRNLCHSSTNKCSLCETVCLGQARMVSHMRVHTGERPFDCGVCGLNFKHQENLKRHQKTHESSKQRNTTSPKHKQIRKTLEQRKRSNSEYMDLHEPFQSSVVKSRDKVQCMPHTEGIKGCSASKDNFTDSNVCKETEVSASVKDNVDSHCSFLKGDERKLICSVDEALSTEQSTVEIFACSVVLDKINLQGQDTEVYLKHHTKEKLTTNITPVKIHCPLGSPTNSKTNADKGGSTDSVQKNAPRGEGVFKCPLCNKSYSHKRSLNKHIRHVHPDHWHQETVLSTRSKKKIFMCKYKCEKCDFRFFSTAGLIRHQNRFCSMKPTDSSEEKRMSTSQSNQKVRGKEALRQNRFSSSEVESGSGNKKTNICRFCGRIFSRRINLCQHEQMHIRKKLNVAISETEQGSFSSTSQNDLSPVNSDELSDAPKQHKCKFCGRMFLRRINLFQHEQMHIRKKLNAVKSEAEKESFSSTSQNDHSPVILDELSDASKEHKCKFCGKMFPRWINLFQHVQMHIRKKLNAVKSEAEKESFSSTSQNDHSPVILDELSDASKQHKCKFCGRIFSRRINLRQHEQVHVRERSNTTESNAEHQSFSSALQNHQSPVNSDKDSDASKPKTHKCKFCGRMFSRRINLIQHEQVHKRRKQVKMVLDEVYLMESCDKKRSGGPGKNAFKISSLQINHKCRFCARKFFRRCNLCQHERVCHRRQIVQKQKFETSSRTKTHNSSSKKVSVSSVENPLAISNNKFNKCQYCRKIFSTKSNLNRHVKLHKQKNKFLRQKNNNSKKTDDSLYAKKKSPETIINQVRIISTDNRHPCQQCGKWFTQKLDLSQHLKLHIQKSIQLEQGNSANNSSSMKSDVHTDTSESGQNFKKENINKTPHICRFCGRLFARRINLCQHERVCHRRQIIRKQKPENSNRTKTHNSNLKKVSVSSVENPLSVISNNKFNKCQYCRKIFSTKSNLNRHVKLHKQKKKFLKQKNNNSKKTDDSLDAKRKSNDSIRNQVRIISADNWHSCQYCGKWFPQKLDLSHHLKLHIQKSIQLEQRNTANSSSSVITDLRTDTSESGQNFKKENIIKAPHICRFCGRLFARRINLCQHEQWHKQKDGKVFKENNKKATHICRSCGRCFDRRVNLCQHERWHSQKNVCLYRQEMVKSKPFQAKRKKCQVCSKTCTNKSDLVLHYESRHTENLKCQICNTLLGTYVHLRKHMRTHVELSMVDMKEQSHRKRAKYTNASHFHKKTKVGKRSQVTGKSNKVTKSKKYKCTVCGMSFNNHSLLFLHKKKHTMSAHACFVCGKIFTRKFDLARHLQIHTGDQPHECDICLEGFRCRVNLAEHMGTHVLKEANEFQCDGCKALFCDQQSILNHLESAHTSHHKVSHLGTQIINNDNELQGNEHSSGSETIESDSVINYIQSKKPIFSCGICGEAFEEASHLCVHMGNHVSESTEIENGKETGMTVKAESYSPNRQMDVYKQSCKLENHPSHNDMQNSQGHVCLSDFVDAIKNETVVNEVSSLDGEGNIFDHANDSLSDEYIDEDIGVDPSESISEFLNVKHHSEMDEKTVSVDNNGTNIGDITKILDCTELNKNFKCGLCMHTFSSKQGLSQHKRWHASTDAKFNQMKKDYCTVCKIYFASKSSYTLHLNWHKSGLAKKVVISDKISIPLKPYRCEKCGKTFTRKDSLAKHKCMMHYSQDDGGDKSRSKVAISKGVMKTVVPNGFRCDVCGCSYAQRACLVQHLLHKHNLVEKHFKAVCDEKEKPVRSQLFLNNAGLTSHNTKDQKRNQKSYKCIFCKKQYIKKHAYLLHTSRVHPSYYQQVLGKMAEESSNKKKCKYCKIWYNPNDNSGHKNGFNCRSCEKIFSCKGCFIQHLDLPESSELEGGFWCCVCRIKFSNRNELEEHVPLHATDHGKYNCRMCSQVFKYKQHLFRHEKVHRISMQYSLKESYACKWCNEVFPFEHAMHLHEKTKHCIDHKTSRKPKKRQVLVTAESYNCTNLANAVEVNMASPAGVGSDIFSSSLPRQYDAISLDQAYCKKFFTKAADETICKNDQGKKVVSNLGSLEAFPMSIKQEPVDLCDNSVCGSTCTSPVKEVENNGIVHNSDFDTSIPDSPFLNRVGSDTTKFDLSPSVQLNERVKQDDIQRCFEDSDQDEVDIDDIHDGNSSPIDRSDVLYFVGSTMATGQNDSLDLLKEVLEKPAYSEAQSSHKSPPDLVKAAFKLPIPRMESSNKNDNSHSCKPLYLEDSADDASMDDLLEASKNTPKYLKQTEDVLRKDASDHSQEHQIVKDDKPTTSVINQESKERIQCIICCKMVYSHELVRHLQSHADLKLYECKHCDECFLSAMSYSEHMEKNYGEIVCCACGETFTEKEDLIMHVKKHNFDVVLNCSICGAIFTSNDTFSKHLEFHVISEAKSAETRNDSSDDVEIISSEDREEEEENLRALMEDQGDADMTLSSVITSSLAAWKQMSLTFLSEGSVEAARKDDSATEIIDNPGELLGTCKDAATSEDIKPDITKLHDIMSMQNAYMNMEAIMGCNQTILDGMVQNSTSQVGAEPINTVSGTPLDWYSKWKKLTGKITGSEHTHQYDRGQKEQCQAAPSTSSNRFPIRTELREPDNVPVIKKEFFEQDTQLLLDESERPRTTGRTGLMQPGLKPCYVKLEKIDCEILTCRLCHRILVTENALKLHYFLHLIPGYEFS